MTPRSGHSCHHPAALKLQKACRTAVLLTQRKSTTVVCVEQTQHGAHLCPAAIPEPWEHRGWDRQCWGRDCCACRENELGQVWPCRAWGWRGDNLGTGGQGVGHSHSPPHTAPDHSLQHTALPKEKEQPSPPCPTAASAASRLIGCN